MEDLVLASQQWMELLQDLLRGKNDDEKVDLIEAVLHKMIDKEYPISELDKLVKYGEDVGDETGRYAEWTEYAAAHGNMETWKHGNCLVFGRRDK